MSCIKRLTKEFNKIQKCPIPNLYIKPADNDIQTWYFLIHSLEDCDYAGGVYMGIVKVPNLYPMKAPTFQMTTPSGRFQTYVTLCTTFSHYHPEQWSPNWKIGSTLMGLVSFMLEDGHGIGSILRTSKERKQLAKSSIANNYKNKDFRNIFLADFPDQTQIVSKLKKINEQYLIMEKEAAKNHPEEQKSAPVQTPPATPVSSKPVAAVSRIAMDLNALIWLFLDACIEEDEESAHLEFGQFCKSFAKWTQENGYYPSDYNNKITKKAIHAELKKIKPDEYVKGKYLRGLKLI